MSANSDGTASDYVDSYYARTRADDRYRPALDNHIQVEVCVVGGGMAGLATDWAWPSGDDRSLRLKLVVSGGERPGGTVGSSVTGSLAVWTPCLTAWGWSGPAHCTG